MVRFILQMRATILIVMLKIIVITSEKHNAKADSATQKLLQKTALNAASIADLNQDDKITFKEYEFFVSLHFFVYILYL